MIIGQQVKAYRNLNNGKIAVQDMKGKVIGYCDSLLLSDCVAKVGKGTSATIKRKFEESGKKDRNVHAFIIGTIVKIDEDLSYMTGGMNVSYNPFFSDYFYYSYDKSKEYTGSRFVAFKAAPKGEKMISLAFN
jgi:hypothetical protein